MPKPSPSDQLIQLPWSASSYQLLALLGLLGHVSLLTIPPFHPFSDLTLFGTAVFPYFPFLSTCLAIGINSFVTYTIFNVTNTLSFNGLPAMLKPLLSSNAARSIQGYLVTFLILGYLTTPQLIIFLVLYTFQLSILPMVFFWLIASPLLIITVILVINRMYKPSS